MKRNPFTLVEILVVIAVIAILMGLMFPALGMVKEKAYMRQSLSDVKAVHMAIKSFKNDYGYLPDPNKNTTSDVVYYGTGSTDNSTTTTTDTAKCVKVDNSCVFKSDESLNTGYVNLFSVLCARTTAGAAETTGLNPKKVTFLTPTAKYTGSDNAKNGSRDPWGRPYLVFLDTNYDGEIELPGGKKIYDDAAVVGLGSYDPTAGSADDKISKALESKNASKIVTSWQ